MLAHWLPFGISQEYYMQALSKEMSIRIFQRDTNPVRHTEGFRFLPLLQLQGM
jgi:hypothetical protein